MLADYVQSAHEEVKKDINSVRIAGWIVSKYEGRSFIKLVVNVKDKKNYGNYPTIYAFKDKEGNTPIDNYYVKDYIALSGHMSSMPDYKTEGEPVQQLVLDSVHKPRKMADGKNAGKYIDTNSVYLKGIVTNVEHTKNISYVTVESVTKEGIKNSIRFVDFTNASKDIDTGLEYEVNGFVKTKRKADETGRRKPIYYQDVVMTRIQKPKKPYEGKEEEEADLLSQLDDVNPVRKPQTVVNARG